MLSIVLQELQKEEMACDMFVEFRNSKLRGKVSFSPKKDSGSQWKQSSPKQGNEQ